MTVKVIMSDEEFARVKFEQFLAHNHFSTQKETDGTYCNRHVQNMWVAFRVGLRCGRESAGGECEL